MQATFCPECWAELIPETPPEQAQCPHCGYDLHLYDTLPYQHKLVRALHHPLSENRIMAAHVLGEQQALDAVPALADMLQQETNFFVLKEVLVALKKMQAPQSDALLQTATTHQSTMVARVATSLLN